ncbi:MAG: DUF937 domain-containing protein [Chloroflexi bacterium]|nr:DUF937 domain-containing protein [Chloroflexota bacterium]
MDVSNMLGGLGGADPMKFVGAISDVFRERGGVEGFVNQLKAGGLGGAVDSWVSTGSNQPVEPAKLADALGPNTVNQLASKSGMDVGQLLPMLAGILPMIVDFLTPGGQLPKEGGVGGLGDLGGLLGGLMGGGGAGGSAGMDAGGLGSMLGGLLGGNGGGQPKG